MKIYEKPAGSAKHEYDAVITDQNGKPATLDRVHLEITLSMNNMHHESEGDMKQTGDGQYAVKLKWAMDGDWKAAITLEKEKYKKTIRAAITPSS
ncbi:hypothetical protein GZH47_31380 (plasmid) [Paenibacillus rhizovicinus]|uniref:YtkA-like domain-containing protein n=1 Tax=Paenibacillus rhizovicinus TaxID=2704463 RepID=A0A6C0PAJ8_9BACL|nr:hypothetical protein GZH47_31380 [Paenibacillus rhizovicinus]